MATVLSVPVQIDRKILTVCSNVWRWGGGNGTISVGGIQVFVHPNQGC